MNVPSKKRTAPRKAASLTDIDLGPIAAEPLGAGDYVDASEEEPIPERADVDVTLAAIASIIRGLTG